MIYASSVFLFSLHHHARPRQQRSIVYVFFLLVYSILVTVIYLVWQNPVFHQVSYAILVFLLIYEALFAMASFPQIKTIVLTSLFFYVLAFCLWNIDNAFCSSLRSIRQRHSKNVFLQGGTQFHAWWHIFSGYASNLHIVFSSHARLLYLKRSCSIKLLDELPMIYGSCIYIYSSETVNSTSNAVNIKWFCAALAYSCVSTFVYLQLTSPLLFQCFYGVVVCAVLYETVSVGLRYPMLRSWVALSVFLYAFGFALWNIDIHFCSRLRSARSSLKYMFDATNVGTQLHAWWHILAGSASYIQVQMSVSARCINLNVPCYIANSLGWPYLKLKQEKNSRFD